MTSSATQSFKSVGTLRGRSLKFLIIIILSFFLSLYFSLQAQNKILSLSSSMHEQILPTVNLLEAIRLELDLQIREIQLVTALADPNQKNKAPRLALIRLGPSTRSLMLPENYLKISPDIAQDIKEWVSLAQNYSGKVASFENEISALYDLKRLREKIDLTHRKLKNGLSIQLLELSQNASRSLLIWACTFAVSFLTSLILLFLLWKWLQPLKDIERWFQSKDPSQWAPASIRGSGLLAPPQEVRSLANAIHENIQAFHDYSEQISERVLKAQETEKSAGTLITLLYHLGRRNEELLQQLIENEKLASMGKMAAQLAHEIRNPLNSLSLKLELLLQDAPESLKKPIELTLKEIDRLDALTESHLRTTKARLQNDLNVTISTEKELEKQEELLTTQALFENLRNLFQLDLEAKNIFFSFRGEIFEIPLPSSVIKAALINLIKNSIDVLRNTNTRREIVFEARQQKKNKTWSITVKDTGPGFPEAYLSEPFRIFQTTKSQGTGLGLTTAKSMLHTYGVALHILEKTADFGASVEILGQVVLSNKKTLIESAETSL